MPVANTRAVILVEAHQSWLIALVSGTVAIMSLDPGRLPHRGLRWIVALIAVCLTVGWILDASRDGFSALLTRLDWRMGCNASTRWWCCLCPL